MAHPLCCVKHQYRKMAPKTTPKRIPPACDQEFQSSSLWLKCILSFILFNIFYYCWTNIVCVAKILRKIEFGVIFRDCYDMKGVIVCIWSKRFCFICQMSAFLCFIPKINQESVGGYCLFSYFCIWKLNNDNNQRHIEKYDEI